MPLKICKKFLQFVILTITAAYKLKDEILFIQLSEKFYF